LIRARGGGWFLRSAPGDFDPYAPLAKAWVEALRATVIVELGVRFGHSTRAFLEGARAVDRRVWEVDPLERHDVQDDRFTFIQVDPIQAAPQWDRIDLLHIDIDLHCEGDARRWLAEYASRCRAIAVHHSHHPGYRLRPVIAELAATGGWDVYEYRGNLGGWTVLTRRGESCPDDDG
jgi:hypothetical protein